MELFIEASLLENPDIAQERRYYIPVQGEELEVFLSRHPGENLKISVGISGRKNTGKTPDGFPVVIMRKLLRNIDNIRETGNGSWLVDSRRAETALVDTLTKVGYLGRAEFTFAPKHLDEIGEMIHFDRQDQYSSSYQLRYKNSAGSDTEIIESREITLSHSYYSSIVNVSCYLFNSNWTPPFKASSWFKKAIDSIRTNNEVSFIQEVIPDFEYKLDLNDTDRILHYIRRIDIRLLKEITVTFNFRIRKLLGFGIRHYRNEDLPGAHKIFQKARNLFPESPEVSYNCGIISDKLGDKTEAIRMMEEALEKDGHFHKAFLNLSALLFEMGRLEESSRKAVQGLMTLPPDWIRERLLVVKKELDKTTLREIVERHRLNQAGLVAATGLEDMRKYVSILTGKKCRSCDMVLLPQGTIQYNLLSDDDVLRVHFEDSFLVIQTDHSNIPDLRFSLPMDEDPEKRDLSRPSMQADHETYMKDFRFIGHFLRAIDTICSELGMNPTKLFYVVRSDEQGEWKSPVSFTPDNHEEALREVETSFSGYQINFDLITREITVLGRANPSWGRIIEIEGRNDIVRKIRSALDAKSLR